MTIQIGPFMIPCRRCKAAPSDDCTFTSKDGRGPLRVGETRPNVHKVRERDAARVSELLDW